MYPTIKAYISEEEKKYAQAKKDILQAIKSFYDLCPHLQIQLANELYDVVKILTIYQITQ